MQVHIRKATELDWPNIWEIFRLIIKSGDTVSFAPDISMHQAQEYWMGKDIHTYVAELDGKIIGIYIIKPKQIFQLYGLKHALDTMGPRELRMMFKHHRAQSWNKLMTDAGNVTLQRTQDVFGILRKHIMKSIIPKIQ